MSGRPEITPEMRARALTLANNWLHVVDPTRYTTLGIPAEAVVGRYLVDADGLITDQYVPNPRFVPREPANELEAVMRLGTPADVLTAVLGADLVLPADPTRTPRRHVVLRREGREQVLDVFASPEALPRDWPPHWHRFTGVELAVVVDRLGEPVRLRLAESSDVRFDIRSEALVDALRGATAQAGRREA